MSSDLDADRLDYLARTAAHTGLPYGIADIEYLLARVDIDDRDRVCFDEKALRSAEHMLLARFFDYQTLVAQRTVAGLEKALAEVLAEMIRAKKIPGSKSEILSSISDNSWEKYDDLSLMNEIRDYNEECGVDHIKCMLNCVVNRVPPKVIGEYEWIETGQSKENTEQSKDEVRKTIEGARNAIAGKINIPVDNLMVWTRSTQFTKYFQPDGKSPDDVGDITGGDGIDQGVRIMNRGENTSKSIFELKWSLIGKLCGSRFNIARLYLVPQIGVTISREDRHEYSNIVKSECSSLGWK